MSIKGFSVGGVVQRYDYTALDNLPQGQGVSDDLKAALLQLAQKVAYIDDQGQTYYDDLYNALYPEKTLLSITANFQQGQAVIYNTDSLDTLKQYLTVTAVYDDASTELVPSSAYTLSGTLTTGTSVITVTYEGKTDAFNVTVTAAPMSFNVTNTLTGCTTSNSATSVLENTSYTAVITASSGYTLVGATVSITMGGQDITASAYSGGIISINSVTGALVISVSAAVRVLSSISAVYTQSGTVYDTDSLDSLKADLVVTATYSDSSTQTVPAADYTLSGTLSEGASTISVSYGGKDATFTVNCTVNGWLYHFNQSLVSSGSKDFGLAGEYAEYVTGKNGYAYNHPADGSIVSGATSGYAIRATGLTNVPNLSGDFTFSGWVKGTSDTIMNLFTAYRCETSATANVPNAISSPTMLSNWTSADPGNVSAKYKGVRVQTVSGKLRVELFNASGSGRASVSLVPPTGFVFSAWHHYAVTRKSGTVTIFVDGVAICSFTYNATIFFASQIAVSGAFKIDLNSTETTVNSAGNTVDDFFIAEYCKWESAFDPEQISY